MSRRRYTQRTYVRSPIDGSPVFVETEHDAIASWHATKDSLSVAAFEHAFEKDHARVVEGMSAKGHDARVVARLMDAKVDELRREMLVARGEPDGVRLS